MSFSKTLELCFKKLGIIIFILILFESCANWFYISSKRNITSISDDGNITFKYIPERSFEDVNETIYRFQEYYKDVPIEGGEILFRSNKKGDIVSMASSAIEISEDMEISNSIDKKSAIATIEENMRSIVEKYIKQIIATSKKLKITDAKIQSALALLENSQQSYVDRLMKEIQIEEPSNNKLIVTEHNSQYLVGRYHTSIAGNLFNFYHDLHLSSDRLGKIYQVLNLNKNFDLTIYDSSVGNPILSEALTKEIYKNGVPDKIAFWLETPGKENYEAFKTVLDFFSKQFSYNSYDGKNSSIRSFINVKKYSFFDMFHLKENASWVPDKKIFIFGANGKMITNIHKALDIVGHEFTHAVIENTSNLLYKKESGALNEHLADVFGALIENSKDNKNGFLIGDTVLTQEYKNQKGIQAIRDMETPALGIEIQPENINEIPDSYDSTKCVPSSENDNCGVHFLNGIMNKAFALIVKGDSNIKGLGWEKAPLLYFNVMTKSLVPTTSFQDFAISLYQECKRNSTLYSSTDCQSIKSSFKEVGVDLFESEYTFQRTYNDLHKKICLDARYSDYPICKEFKIE